jgi:hypothetical protein
VTFKDRAYRCYSWLIANWNALLAAVSFTGVAIVGLVPPLQHYLGIFVFAAANAIVWTLIEIKIQLGRQPKIGAIYPTMRSARPDIISAIWAECREAHGRHVHVQVIGGRIRSAGDIVREVVTEICEGARAVSNLTIDVYCLDPKDLAELRLPGAMDETTQLARNESYATIVAGFHDELLSFNAREQLISANVSLAVTYYVSPPPLYCYVIGTSTVFWSGCTWDAEQADFEGSGNPCFCLTRKDQGFGELRAWLVNRMSYFGAAKATQLS